MAKAKKNSGTEFPARIKALFLRPQDQWGVREWRTLALWLHSQLDTARDGWRAALAECEGYTKLVYELLKLLSTKQRQDQFIASIEARRREFAPKLAAKEKPTPGRPKTRNPEEVLAAWEAMRELVLKEAERKLSERKQLIVYFEREFAKRGMNKTRVTSPPFQSKLKTFRNVIAQGRRMKKTRPE